MPLMREGESAMAAAITEENPARTSGTSTSAPRSPDTPVTTAEWTAALGNETSLEGSNLVASATGA